jgi:hypothetical protein
MVRTSIIQLDGDNYHSNELMNSSWMNEYSIQRMEDWMEWKQWKEVVGTIRICAKTKIGKASEFDLEL